MSEPSRLPPTWRLDIARTFDEAFSSAIRAARNKFSRTTARAVDVQTEEEQLEAANTFDGVIVMPALLALVNAKRATEFPIVVVPDVLLKAWLMQWLDDPVANAQSERTLRAHASWPEFRQWTEGRNNAVNDAVRIRSLVGLDADGTPIDAGAWAAAQARRPFRLVAFSRTIERAARDTVLEARRVMARDTAAYARAVRASVQTAQSDPMVLVLPFRSRALRITNIARMVPNINDAVTGQLIAAVYVSRDADDDDPYNLAVPIADADDADEDDATGGVSPERALTRAVLMIESTRATMQRVNNDLTVAGAASRIEAQRAALQAQLDVLSKTKRVPLVANRLNTSGQGFSLHLQVRNVPRAAAVTVTWYFEPWAGGSRRVLRTVDLQGQVVADDLIVIDNAACGMPAGLARYSADRVAGRYWAEARADGLAAKSMIATLHVWAVCARDGVQYELGVPQTFGECSWHAKPTSRKRRLDVATYRRNAGEPDGPEQMQFDDDIVARRDAGPVDLTDDGAVLAAGGPNAVAAYGYAATLRRIEARIGELLALVKRVSRAPPDTLDFEWQAILAAGHARTLRATDVYDVPVLSMLAALQVAAGDNILLPDEAAFLLDTLPARIMDTFVPAWRACCAGQRYIGARVQQLMAGLLSRDRADELERSAAKEAVARMTADEMLVAQVWADPLLAPYAGSGKAAFFTDTASLARVRDRAATVGLAHRPDSVRMQRGGAWTGEHNWQNRDADWYAVAFQDRQECVLVKRGSERVVAGAWPGQMHDEIDALRTEYNGLSAAAADAGGQRLSIALRRSQLQEAIKQTVVAFNVRMQSE